MSMVTLFTILVTKSHDPLSEGSMGSLRASGLRRRFVEGLLLGFSALGLGLPGDPKTYRFGVIKGS